MYFEISELFLMAWAIIMTVLWVRAKERLKFLEYRIGNTLAGVAKGKLKVIDHGDHCEVEEI